MAHRVPTPKWLAAFMLALSAGEESEIMGDLEISVTSVRKRSLKRKTKNK